MNTYTLVLSNPRITSLVTVHSLMCATAIILLVFLTVSVTVESANIRDAEYRSKYNNPELSEVQKREVNSPVVGTDSNKVMPASNGETNISISSTTSGPAHDKNVKEKLNCSLEANNVNKTICPNTNRSDDPDGYFNSWKQHMIDNKEMLLRTLYVTLGITGIIVVYFVARTCWLRNRRTKSRKYRIIAQNGDQRDLEMEPLGDGNDDDEDYTVFELNGRKK